MKKIGSGLILVLLLIGMLTLEFSIQPVKLPPKAITGSTLTLNLIDGETRPQGKWNMKDKVFRNSDLLRNLKSLTCNDDESVELIIGVETSESQIKSLKDKIFTAGGEVTSNISTCENVRALTAKVALSNVYFFIERLQSNKLVKYLEPNSKVKAFYTPNDPGWSGQWGPKKIEADVAWDTTIGSSDILVAIIDTGIDYTHVDLAKNYVPLGYDWVNNDADPKDDNGHGTHCAGIVAAELNNSIGIAGLGQVCVMAEKVLDWDGWGYYSWVAQGIYHAVDIGARIISMSLGGSADSEPLHDAVKYAYDHGVLIVVAAGNSGDTTMQYPAAYDEVIAVSATDSLDNLASFSSFGDWIELSAPGVDIYSTLPVNSYGSMSGTSMACPHVTGVAALAWSACPNYTRNQIRVLLQRSAEDLSDVGFDQYFGYGRVNARRAVAGIPEHDIKITAWQHRYRLDPGQLGIFTANVSNFGRSNETDVSVQFFVNDTLIDIRTISFLETEASVMQSFLWNTTTIGTYNVTCYAVPVTGENLTENNIVSSDVFVRFPATLRVPYDFSTLKEAIKKAGDGDIIMVCEGYYAEGRIDIFKDNITLIADGIVTLDGQGGTCVLNIQGNHVTIDGFYIRNGTSYGVNVRGYSNIITRNLLHCSSGICLRQSSNCTVQENLVKTDKAYSDWWSSEGITLVYSVNNTVGQNRLVSDIARGGINVRSSSNNTVTENVIMGGIWLGGLILDSSSWNFIASNNIAGNRVGLALIYSPDNTLRNNRMAHNWCNFAPWTSFYFEGWWSGASDVDASNTVDEKPIFYWVNVTDSAVPLDAGCVVLVDCRNITIENLDLKNNYNGIFLVNSSDILIRRNTVSHNFCNYDIFSGGILAGWGSWNITVMLNNITANDNGVRLWGFNNTISLNTISNNFNTAVELADSSILTQNNITGNEGRAVCVGGSGCLVKSNNMMSNLGPNIIVSGSNHTITSNNIIGNGIPSENIINIDRVGILLGATDCTISSNNIIRCAEYGIMLYQASNNSIFHNNFISNTKQVHSLDSESANVWDGAYPSGGNYWSNYSGLDIYKGPYQNETGSDGIGDTAHVLDANNVDRYPLMTIFTENPPPITYRLILSGQIDGNPTKGFYETTAPLPGTYIFMEKSVVRIDTRLSYRIFVDHWELDGTSIGTGDFVEVEIRKDCTLKACLSSVPQLQVQVNPTSAKIALGNSVNFTSSVSGGRPPYEYQWLLNGIEVLNAITPAWTFAPVKNGTYKVELEVRYPFSAPYTANSTVKVFTWIDIQGDVDKSGQVDMGDIIQLCGAFGAKRDNQSGYYWHTPPCILCPHSPNCDIDKNDQIDMTDIIICCAHFGEHQPD